jgi:hypothetical protein
MGQIRVQLISSAGNNIMDKTFSVATNTPWMKKSQEVTIPDGGTGTYTLMFSCLGTNSSAINSVDAVGQTVAYLDAVHLCKKHWFHW